MTSLRWLHRPGPPPVAGPPYLRGQHQVGGSLSRKEAAQATLALARPVERCRVDIADPRPERLCDHAICLRVRQRSVHVSQRRSPEPQTGHTHTRRADLYPFQRVQFFGCGGYSIYRLPARSIRSGECLTRSGRWFFTSVWVHASGRIRGLGYRWGACTLHADTQSMEFLIDDEYVDDVMLSHDVPPKMRTYGHLLRTMGPMLPDLSIMVPPDQAYARRDPRGAMG